jgi:type VI secretion system protein ImpK
MQPSMSFPGFRESLLLTQFWEFYMEVLRLKAALESARAVTTGEPSAAPDAGAELTPEAIHQALLATLERQALAADRSGGAFAYEVYREAQYVFAALGDEVFLNFDWEGRKAWPLLESRLFQSHVAGELFFDKLENLLYKRGPVYEDLAAVYFMALSLGFKGKYRGAESTADLDRYRRELFLKVFHQHPHLLGEERSLFPQSHLHTLMCWSPSATTFRDSRVSRRNCPPIAARIFWGGPTLTVLPPPSSPPVWMKRLKA